VLTGLADDIHVLPHHAESVSHDGSYDDEQRPENGWVEPQINEAGEDWYDDEYVVAEEL
jgi:hypothetical protein